MATRKVRVINAGGDTVMAEWDTETVTRDRLAEIEQEFNDKMAKGFFVADITEAIGEDGRVGPRNEIIKKFDPNADMLMIPRVAGGR